MSDFTSDEVLQQARENAQALALVSAAYVRAKGLPVRDYWSFVGGKFTWGWERLEGKGAREAMRMFAVNMVSVGGTLASLSGDERRAQAVIADWPSSEMLEAFGVEKGDADGAFGVFDAIAGYLGLTYKWYRQGNKVTLELSQ